MPTFRINPDLEAFDDNAVGSKVVDKGAFFAHLSAAVEVHDASRDRAEGQHFVLVPEGIGAVSCGVGRRTNNPEDYVLRSWRGRVDVFLKREHAAECTWLAVIVYTLKAWNNDPQVVEESRSLDAGDYVVVAVLANGEGVPNARSPYRLCDSLAGGNREMEKIGIEDVKTLAEASRDYARDWCVVAD
jgi:hypothetical protein